jgi:hypothetical protein
MFIAVELTMGRLTELSPGSIPDETPPIRIVDYEF